MTPVWDEILEKARSGSDYSLLLNQVSDDVINRKEDVPIKFGTSGWRAEIGSDYTVYNIQKVTQGIIDFYKNEVRDYSDHLGVDSFDQFRRRGVLLGHDNRFMGPDFAKAVAIRFNNEGVRVAYCGTAATPEFSAGVLDGNFACSINLTPSHNPGNYGGYKLNVADGGSAGSAVTGRIEHFINGNSNLSVLPSGDGKWENYDSLSAYIKFISGGGFVDLNYCKSLSGSGKIVIAADSFYGSTKGRFSRILGNPAGLKQFRVEDNPIFGGFPPEPSEKNMADVKEYIDSQSADLKLGAIMDPDGDRVLFYDGESFIHMNQFGVIVFHYLAVKRNKSGGAAKSVATSNFINIVSNQLNRPLYETSVGFKNFRSHLLPGTKEPAIVAFEESDGISGYGNTLEKDAYIGFLLGLEITGRTGQSLSVYLRSLEKEYGAYYPLRSGFPVEAHMAGEPLKKIVEKLKSSFKPGSSVKTGRESKVVRDVITVDGLKLVFEDESWLLIRPSGTEPKMRVYTESTDPEDSKALFEAAKNLYTSSLGA